MSGLEKRECPHQLEMVTKSWGRKWPPCGLTSVFKTTVSEPSRLIPESIFVLFEEKRLIKARQLIASLVIQW